MSLKLFILKSFISFFFLTVYCNVLILQFHCNISHLLKAREQHDNGEAPHAEHSHKDSQKHNDSKDDNCCNDKTAAFFASQTNPVDNSFEFKNTFFAGFTIFLNVIVSAPLPFDSKGYFSYESPPPKIPDIRVFTHSFLV